MRWFHGTRDETLSGPSGERGTMIVCGGLTLTMVVTRGGVRLLGSGLMDGRRLGEPLRWLGVSKLLDEGRLDVLLEILRERKLDSMAGWTYGGWKVDRVPGSLGG